MRISSCPQCGSSDLNQHGARLQCSFCNTQLVMESDESLAWICGECGFRNVSDSTFCGSCGEPLKKICYDCRDLVRGSLDFCPKCGFGFLPGEKLIFYHQDRVSSNYLSNLRLYCRSLLGKGSRQLLLEDIQEIVIISVLGAGFAIGIKGYTGKVYPQPEGDPYHGNTMFIQMNVPTKEEAVRFAESIIENTKGQSPLLRFPGLTCLGRVFATALTLAALLSLLW